MFQLL